MMTRRRRRRRRRMRMRMKMKYLKQPHWALGTYSEKAVM
jgi:hypothetical protein